MPDEIAVLVIKAAPASPASPGGALFTPEDVLQIAAQLHEMEEYRAADPRQRDRPDWPVLPWETLTPERQWELWHRAAAAVQQGEAARRLAAA